MQKSDFERLLGLSSKERRVYRSLDETPLPVSEIRKETSLPRMTVHYALERLWKRGLLERVKRNKRFLYSRVPWEQLLKQLLPTQGVPEGGTRIPVSESADIIIHKGWNGIYAMYKRITEENKGQRLHTIQTTFSTKHIFENYSLEQLDSLHELMKENEIIVEDIVESDFFEPVFSRFGEEDFESAVNSFLDRLTVTYVLPENYIDFTTDMVIFKDVVVFIDWSKQIAFEVKTDQIVEMCMNFYEILREKAEKTRFGDLAKKYMTGEKK